MTASDQAIDDVAGSFLDFTDRREAVLTIQKATAKGRQSGATVQKVVPWIMTMRGGKIIRIDHPASLEEALEMVGLSEQDAHADF